MSPGGSHAAIEIRIQEELGEGNIMNGDESVRANRHQQR
jgi:hypothetical protein